MMRFTSCVILMVMFDYFLHGTLRRPYRLHVAHTGPENKPVIILLHGIAASGEDWQKVLPHLRNNYHCITIDLLGFGRSPKPQWLGYTMSDHVGAIDHTIKRLRLKKPYILAGHSLGALLVARYATKHEQSIARLLLLSPPVYPPLHSIGSKRARRLTGVLLSIYRFLREDPRITPTTFKRLQYIAPLPKGVTRHPETWVPFMRTLQACIETQTVLSDIAAIRTQTDVFYGSLDQVVVNENVELLGKHPHVTLHKFVNTHDLTTRYGKLVARTLAVDDRDTRI